MSMRTVLQKAAQCSSLAQAAEGFGLARHFSMTSHSLSVVPHSKDGYVTHPDLLNEAVKRTQYAVRGELYLRAMQLQNEGMKITFTNGTYAIHLLSVSGIHLRTHLRSIRGLNRATTCHRARCRGSNAASTPPARPSLKPQTHACLVNGV